MVDFSICPQCHHLAFSGRDHTCPTPEPWWQAWIPDDMEPDEGIIVSGDSSEAAIEEAASLFDSGDYDYPLSNGHSLTIAVRPVGSTDKPEVFIVRGEVTTTYRWERVLSLMTPEHPDWEIFTNRLSGPEGCAFQESESGKVTWRCAGGHDQSFARAILATMPGIDVDASLAYFSEHNGRCDCEILFNVDPV